MGYYKQQQIASQTELPERVPAPRPASSHVSLTVRRSDMRKPARDYTGIIVFGAMALMFVMGVVIGVMA